MQIATIPFRGQKKPWGSIPRINLQHSIADGLVFYGYDTGSGVIELLHNTLFTFTTGTRPLRRVTKYGWGWAYTDGGAGYFTGANYSLSGSNYSIAIAWNITALPGSSNCIPFGLNQTGSNNFACFLWNQTANTDVQFVVNNAFGTKVTFNTINTYHSMVGVSTGTTSQVCYGDGNQIATSAITDGATTGLAINLNGGGGNSTTPIQNNVAGQIFYCAYWNRQLTPREVKTLHFDPYCFLIYPEDEIFRTFVGVSQVITTSEDQYHQDWSHIGRKILITGTG